MTGKSGNPKEPRKNSDLVHNDILEATDPMYKIDEATYGFRITNSGQFSVFEAEEFKRDLLRRLSEHNQPFSLLIDIRNLIPLSPEVMSIMREVQLACRQMSLERVAMVMSSPVVRGQAQQVSFDTRTNPHDRYIDAARNPNWEKAAIDWLVDGVEPLRPEKANRS